MADDDHINAPEMTSHVRFYGSFVDMLKWSIGAIALTGCEGPSGLA